MQHLRLEALARLVDDPPDAVEAEHLGLCKDCRAELEAMRRDVEALGRLGELEPTGAEWAALEARLEREGLLAGTPLPGATARRWSPRLLRIAAALALYAVGAGTGLALRGRPAPVTQALTPSLGPAAPEQPVAVAPVEPAAVPPTDSPAIPDIRAVADADVSADPATPEEALRAIRRAEQQYLRAYTRYSELTAGQRQVEDPVAQVAALEGIVLTTRAALDRAPADPVINGYHLSAVAQRDAALRQIALRSNGPWF